MFIKCVYKLDYIVTVQLNNMVLDYNVSDMIKGTKCIPQNSLLDWFDVIQGSILTFGDSEQFLTEYLKTLICQIEEEGTIQKYDNGRVQKTIIILKKFCMELLPRLF